MGEFDASYDAAKPPIFLVCNGLLAAGAANAVLVCELAVAAIGGDVLIIGLPDWNASAVKSSEFSSCRACVCAISAAGVENEGAEALNVAAAWGLVDGSIKGVASVVTVGTLEGELEGISLAINLPALRATLLARSSGAVRANAKVLATAADLDATLSRGACVDISEAVKSEA